MKDIIGLALFGVGMWLVGIGMSLITDARARRTILDALASVGWLWKAEQAFGAPTHDIQFIYHNRRFTLKKDD